MRQMNTITYPVSLFTMGLQIEIELTGNMIAATFNIKVHLREVCDGKLLVVLCNLLRLFLLRCTEATPNQSANVVIKDSTVDRQQHTILS